MKADAIVMSIKPHWSDLIYSGKKTMEIRRTDIADWRLPVYFMESGSGGMITGEVRFGAKVLLPPGDTRISSEGLVRLDDPYVSRKAVYGYRISHHRRYQTPIPASELFSDPKVAKAPMSYYYVTGIRPYPGVTM